MSSTLARSANYRYIELDSRGVVELDYGLLTTIQGKLVAYNKNSAMIRIYTCPAIRKTRSVGSATSRSSSRTVIFSGVFLIHTPVLPL